MDDEAGGQETQPKDDDAPEKAPAPPAPPNIDLAMFAREVEFLAATEPAAILKGLMLECRELVRGVSNRMADPAYARIHSDMFEYMRGSVRLAVELADSLSKLNGRAPAEERLQRIVVERIDRTATAPLLPPQGEGGGANPKND